MKQWRPPPKFYDERDILHKTVEEVGGSIARYCGKMNDATTEPEDSSY